MPKHVCTAGDTRLGADCKYCGKWIDKVVCLGCPSGKVLQGKDIWHK